MRDEVWAEARDRIAGGEPWWGAKSMSHREDEMIRERFMLRDPWEEEIHDFVMKIGPDNVFTMEDVMDHLGLKIKRRSTYHAQRIRSILTRFGYVYEKILLDSGECTYGFVRAEPLDK